MDMIALADLQTGTDAFFAVGADGEPGLALRLFLAAVIILMVVAVAALICVTSRYRRQQRGLYRQEMRRRDISGRRRIKVSDKYAVLERDDYTCQICGISRDYLDSLCPGLGDYLLLEVDHIQSVKQGGTGRDIDNLQCLCWRCNRKKGGWKTNEEVKRSIDYGMDYLDSGLWF